MRNSDTSINSTGGDRDRFFYSSDCQHSSEACSHEVRQELASKPAGTAWNGFERADITSKQMAEKYYGKADSILPPELSPVKTRKQERNLDDAPAKYASASNLEPESAEQKIAAQQRVIGNRLVQDHARDVAAENTMTSTVPGVEQAASHTHAEPKTDTPSVEQLQSPNPRKETGPAASLTDLHSLTRTEQLHSELPATSPTNEVPHAHVPMHRSANEYSLPDGYSNHGTRETLTNRDRFEQAVLHSPERSPTSDVPREFSAVHHTAEHSVRQTLRLPVEPTASIVAANHDTGRQPTPSVEPSRPSSKTAQARELVFGDPRVMAQNDFFTAHRNTLPDNGNFENAFRTNITGKSESCEPNRASCRRSLSHRDETLISGLGDYAPTNRKVHPTETALFNRQHSFAPTDNSIIMENARKAGARASEPASTSGGGGTSGGRVKQDCESAASPKPNTVRFDGIGTGSNASSNGTSRETARGAQCDSSSISPQRGEPKDRGFGFRSVRNGSGNDAGAAAQLIDSERRTGQMSTNHSKHGERSDNGDNTRTGGRVSSDLICTIRTFDWQLIGKWITTIKLTRWTDHSDWKTAVKPQGDFQATKRNDDTPKSIDIAPRFAKEFVVDAPDRDRCQPSEQLVGVKNTEVKLGHALDNSAYLVRAATAAVRLNIARWIEAAAVTGVAHPTTALKQFLAKSEAEERKWTSKIEPCQTKAHTKTSRQTEHLLQLPIAARRGERSDRPTKPTVESNMVSPGLENIRSARRESDVTRQPFIMNFTIPAEQQDAHEENDEPDTFTLDTPTVLASSSQQTHQSGLTQPIQIHSSTQYTTESGDTLLSIAFKLFSDTRIADLIMYLNRELLTFDCRTLLPAGMCLRLPNQTEIDIFCWSRQSSGLSKSFDRNPSTPVISAL